MKSLNEMAIWELQELADKGYRFLVEGGRIIGYAMEEDDRKLQTDIEFDFNIA